jgi:hypothetical protein
MENAFEIMGMVLFFVLLPPGGAYMPWCGMCAAFGPATP